MRRLRPSNSRTGRRRGMAALQVVMILGMLFTTSAVLYQWAVTASRMLHHFISTMVVAPY